MGSKKLRRLVEHPAVGCQLWETVSEDNIRWDVCARVPLVFLTTYEEREVYYQQGRHNADLLVVERGIIYGWVSRIANKRYGPFAYPVFELVFNGLDEVSEQFRFCDPSQSRQKCLELMKKNIGRHMSAIYRGHGYHVTPSSVYTHFVCEE